MFLHLPRRRFVLLGITSMSGSFINFDWMQKISLDVRGTHQEEKGAAFMVGAGGLYVGVV